MADDALDGSASLTQAQRQILDLVGRRGGMTLAGNRETFAVLYYRNDRWLLKSGDTMTGDSSVSALSPEAACRAICARARDLMEDFGPENADRFADAEVLAFITDWPTST